ncbi:Acetate transporter protein patA [Colletotrichum siamense]|nr:Acetate transporter protein patA [Colletotrichum siamense]
MPPRTQINLETCDTKAYSKWRLADPGPFGYGAFATTLMTLSLSMMGIRKVENQTWEMVRGNTFAYTTLIAFAFYYGGYGFLLIPSVGIMDGYGGKTAEYFNALGNIANVIVYGALELSYILNCAANFAFADGHTSSGKSLTKVAGSFGFIAALAGFYAMASGFCGDVLPFEIPLGDLSRFFARTKLRGTERKAT